MSLIEVSIRPATLSDATEVAEIHSASWRDSYQEVLDRSYLAKDVEHDHLAYWIERLTNPVAERKVFIAETGSAEPVGFVCGYKDKHPKWGSWIDNLHVKQKFRGQKIGEHLIQVAAENFAASAETAGVYVWLFDANRSALKFYTRLGGKIVEHGSSEIPAANGAKILRVAWQSAAELIGSEKCR